MRIVNIHARGKSLECEFDSGEALKIANDVAAEYVVYSGKELSDAEYAALRDAQEMYEANSIAHRFLDWRARSEKEVREKLTGKGIGAGVIERVIAQMRAGGYLNDAVFAGKFVHDALLRKPVGQTRMRQLLRGKGVPPAVIDSVIEANYDTGAEFEAAMKLAGRRLKTKTHNAPTERIFSLRRYLASRGFTRETIDAVAKTIADDDEQIEI